MGGLSKSTYLEDDYVSNDVYETFEERLQKHLHFGQMPSCERPSFDLTDLAVEYFSDSAPREFGKVNKYIASSMSRRACMSPTSVVCGVIYVDRLKKCNSEYLLKISSSELFLISMMISSKFLYDDGINEEVLNEEWAESAYMDLDDLNELEREFLQAINWDLFVGNEEFFRVLSKIERRIAWNKIDKHGFYTYTDLNVLIEKELIINYFLDFLKEAYKIVLVCSVSYLALISTVFASCQLSNMVTKSFIQHGYPILKSSLTTESTSGFDFEISDGLIDTNASSTTNSLDLESVLNLSGNEHLSIKQSKFPNFPVKKSLFESILLKNNGSFIESNDSVSYFQNLKTYRTIIKNQNLKPNQKSNCAIELNLMDSEIESRLNEPFSPNSGKGRLSNQLIPYLHPFIANNVNNGFHVASAA